jgi:cytochrome c oxidase assembly protein subunit 11
MSSISIQMSIISRSAFLRTVISRNIARITTKASIPSAHIQPSLSLSFPSPSLRLQKKELHTLSVLRYEVQGAGSEPMKESPRSKRSELPKMSLKEYQALRQQYRGEKDQYDRQTTIYYSLSMMMIFLALSYASVPIYRAICQRTGWGGTPITDKTKFTRDKLTPVATERRLRVSFTAETSGALPWKFVPQQREVWVVPGETALAFYKAKNTGDRDITGMATYSVTPDHVAPYFSKIQCFCFEEQRLAKGEEVDMPLFFFIDPEFSRDPAMRNIEDVVLHYTFFRAKHDQQHEELFGSQKAAGENTTMDVPSKPEN